MWCPESLAAKKKRVVLCLDLLCTIMVKEKGKVSWGVRVLGFRFPST